MVQVSRLTLRRWDRLETALVVPSTFLDVGETARIALQHGYHEAAVRLIASKDFTDTACLSADVWDLLRLPKEESLDVHLLWDEAQQVMRIGPLVAIMARVRRHRGELAGSQAPVFKRLSEAARSLGVITYVFSPLDVQWGEGIVRGSYWNGCNRWSHEYFPLPDVVYDQIVSRRFERRADVQRSRNKLIHLLYPRYFNAGFFDKWTVFQWLSSDDRTRQHLPPTTLYRTPDQGAQFLREYGDIYLKPAEGSLGQGLIRMHLTEKGSTHYRWRKGRGRMESGVCRDPKTWFGQYHQFLKRRVYLLQKTIPLLPLGSRIWDVRAMLQKDESRKWRRTKMFVRISPPGDIASNVSTGGRAERMDTLLASLPFSRLAGHHMNRRLSAIARQVAHVIEERSGLLLGELGVDLGVDGHGFVWIIEVNAKPWKSPSTEEGSEELVQKSFLRPIAYAKSLAGFSS